MNNSVSTVAARNRINHVKVVVLALLASLVIILIGITARATDDIDGYGVAQFRPPFSQEGVTLSR